MSNERAAYKTGAISGPARAVRGHGYLNSVRASVCTPTLSARPGASLPSVMRHRGNLFTRNAVKGFACRVRWASKTLIGVQLQISFARRKPASNPPRESADVFPVVFISFAHAAQFAWSKSRCPGSRLTDFSGQELPDFLGHSA